MCDPQANGYPPPPFYGAANGQYPPEAIQICGGPYGQQPPFVVAVPPAATGGIFLDNDPAVLVVPPSQGGLSALDYLKTVSSVNIRQKIEVLELLSGFDTSNRYTIYNERGQPIFYAIEDSDFCGRLCCGPARPFQMSILDLFQNEIIHVDRPLACQSCCCFCCLMNATVTMGSGNEVGTIQQTCSIFPRFDVKDAVGNVILKLKGPFFTFSCGGDVEFQVISEIDGSEVGKISKKWSGFVQELMTDADNFSVTFPQDLDVQVKAVLLGAVFLIDAMYFERKNKK